jgi:hypothetical protein
VPLELPLRGGNKGGAGGERIWSFKERGFILLHMYQKLLLVVVVVVVVV